MSEKIYALIAENKKDIKAIRRALLGDDGTGLTTGIVFEISKIKTALQIHNSWINLGRPIIIAMISSGLTYLIIQVIP